MREFQNIFQFSLNKVDKIGFHIRIKADAVVKKLSNVKILEAGARVNVKIYYTVGYSHFNDLKELVNVGTLFARWNNRS